MRLPLPWFLALRYLRPRRTFVSVITVISVVGVMLGVMVLIVVMAVMSGFSREMREKILGFNAHLLITSPGGVLEAWPQAMETTETAAGVAGVSPFILGPVFMMAGDRVFTPFMRGVLPDRELSVTDLAGSMEEGAFAPDDDSTVIGRQLALEEDLVIGDRVTLYSPRQFQNEEEVYLPRDFTVVGIYEVGMWEYDRAFLFVGLEAAQDMYMMGDAVHALAVRLDDPYTAWRLQRELEGRLGPGFRVQTWAELNQPLFDALEVEKNVMFFLLIFIVIVAAFGIASTLITLAVQKTRDIGILKSLGAGSATVVRIFLVQGAVVGALGTILGTVFGVTLLHYRNEFLHLLSQWTGRDLLPQDLYRLPEIPAQLYPRDLVVICVSALVVCTLAGLPPAWRSSRLDPAQALRYE